MDPLQVNGWGLAYGSGGPFWVSDQGSGWSTIYNGQGWSVQQPGWNVWCDQFEVAASARNENTR
jgi:hypothetical protein